MNPKKALFQAILDIVELSRLLTWLFSQVAIYIDPKQDFSNNLYFSRRSACQHYPVWTLIQMKYRKNLRFGKGRRLGIGISI